MAGSAAHPVEGQAPGQGEATLLGYFWNLKTDAISTNKNTKLNLCAPHRGLRPSWGQISEATDLLRLHKEKPFKHRQAFAAAHTLYDSVQSAPYLAAQMKFMYRFLILEETLAK